MAQATKADIERLYDKLDPIGKDVAVIKSQLAEHLKTHQTTRTTWQRSVIGGLVHMIEVAVIAGVAYLWGTKQ
ncbi:hypothetical protein LCGC14_0362210 [marine sediment metagenome]|uniref:Uncharacterized protein n=1 Tax=marine sediment metagenome TaxID=412755 RepID=A0A0F9WFX6_9ZZZZ